MKTKRKYLISELWILAWSASVQHSALYKKGAWQNSRKEIKVFKDSMVKYIAETIISRYQTTVGDAAHLNNIQAVIDYANANDTGVLGDGGYKYGVAQKLLNLSLKYYWCLGEIPEPPHCPVDDIVITKTKYRGKVKWTKIQKEEEYLKVIDAVRKLAMKDRISIAAWELNNYERP